jgi:vacuolar-type H+-ATPase subunit D/Vma8
MTHDVKQWLAEIKLLQQKLATLQQELDEAYTSASNWRKLYETEAQQRRTETYLAQQTIDALQIEIAQLQSSQVRVAHSSEEVIQQEVDQLESPEILKDQLKQALLECDRLARTIKAEVEEHEKTRKSLTSALGDTVDRLAKERAARSADAVKHPNHKSDPSKNPSLERPPLDPAQSLV